MADLKTFYQDQAMQAPDLGGDQITARGCDPNINYSGSSGLQDFWTQDQTVESPNAMETANSVSGLPLHPDRYEPSASSEQPPDLTDRTPGTIDRK